MTAILGFESNDAVNMGGMGRFKAGLSEIECNRGEKIEHGQKKRCKKKKILAVTPPPPSASCH